MSVNYLIVGLGNPDPEHVHNRHNVGFRCVDQLARAHDLRFERTRQRAHVASGTICGQQVLLAKPRTYMNSSGEAVGALARMHRLGPDRILVICDDLDLPFGKLRMRRKGGAAGHHGLESIIQHLGSADFPRLKIGIGRPEFGDPIDYVLRNFSKDEEVALEQVLAKAVSALECAISESVEAAMNKFN